MVDFAADVLTDIFCGFSCRSFGGFSDGFWAIFLRIFQRIFPWILLGITGGLTLTTLPNLRDSHQEISKKFPHEFSVLVGSLLFYRCAGLTRQSHPPKTLRILGVAGRHATMPMLKAILVCLSFSVCFPINLQDATEQLQAAARSKAVLIGIWGSPALPITKKRSATEKITKIHHIFTLQVYGDNVVAMPIYYTQDSGFPTVTS